MNRQGTPLSRLRLQAGGQKKPHPLPIMYTVIMTLESNAAFWAFLAMLWVVRMTTCLLKKGDMMEEKQSEEKYSGAC